MTFKWSWAFKPMTAEIAQRERQSSLTWGGGHNWVIPGPGGGGGLLGVCTVQGVKWRGHRPPTLARSVLAQLFSVQSRPSGCSSSGGGAGPTAHGAAAIPTVGPAAARCHCTQSNTRPPHCSVCCHQTPLHFSRRSKKEPRGREIQPCRWPNLPATAAKGGLPSQLSSSSSE